MKKLLLAGAILTAFMGCMHSNALRSPAGAAVSSFTVGKFTPPAGSPAWAAVDVAMPRQDGDRAVIAKTYQAADFQSGSAQSVSLLVPQGTYKINMTYKDTAGAGLYEVCATAKDKAYTINTPQFTADIAICKMGTQTQVGTATITPNSNVVLNPTLSGAPGGSGGSATGSIVTGFATNFNAVGDGGGGCGVPPQQIESDNYVALNVQNTANDYSSGVMRPIDNAAIVGFFNNGLNCGRWMEVTFNKDCSQSFTNSGAHASNICPDASLVSSPFSGAKINLIVTDSCQDSNGWCRDNFGHIDIHTSALTQFSSNGQTVDVSRGWTNPQVSWKFITAPNYQGDVKIGFGFNWQQYYMPIIITNLPNGLHGVEAKIGGSWKKLRMNSDNGQVYLMETNADRPFQIRLYDAGDQLVNGGRIYQFPYPGSCPTSMNPGCQVSYTAAAVTTVNP